jgi:hypothetical protein
MNRALILVTALSFALPVAVVSQSTQSASVTMPMSPREAHSLMKSAHSGAQYAQLAAYFHQQESDYRAKAAAEKAERDRRAEVNAGLYQKYPRPVDTAESLYESYLASANDAALQAQHYSQLAAAETKHDQQFANGPQGKM